MSSNSLNKRIYQLLLIAGVLVLIGTFPIMSCANPSMNKQGGMNQGGGGGDSVDWGGLIGGILNSLTPRTPQYYPPNYIPDTPPGLSDSDLQIDDEPIGSSGRGGNGTQRVQPGLPAQQESTPTAKPGSSDLLNAFDGNPPEPMNTRPPEHPPVTQQNGSIPNIDTLLAQSPGNNRSPTDPASDADPSRTMIRPGSYNKQIDPKDPNSVRTTTVSAPDANGNVTVTITNRVGDVETTETKIIPPNHLPALEQKLASYTPPPVAATPPQEANAGLNRLPSPGQFLNAAKTGHFPSAQRLEQQLRTHQAEEERYRSAIKQSGGQPPPPKYTEDMIQSTKAAYKPPATERPKEDNPDGGKWIQRTTTKVQGDDFTGGPSDPEWEAVTTGSGGQVYVRPKKKK